MNATTYVQEHHAIAQLISAYLRGQAAGRSAEMKGAFHPQATVFGLKGGNLLGPEIQRLYDAVDQLAPSSDLDAVIGRIDIEGTVASARVDIDNASERRFTDFFNLLKVDGQWMIVGKVFHAHVAAASTQRPGD